MSCKMRLQSILERLPRPRWPMLLYAASWTTILAVTVGMASFTPEIAFVSAIMIPSLSQGCIRLPLDLPSQSLCFPAPLLKHSGTDMLVPPIFATVIVAASAFAVKAMGLWEADDAI